MSSMAEPTCKRPRDDHEYHHDNDDHEHPTKKQRPYDDMILSLLEDDEDVPSGQDLSSFITSLQHELDDPAALSAPSSSGSLLKEDANESAEEEEGMESVMRRLLEASDDELGLPSWDEGSGEFGRGEEGFGDREEGIFYDGLWEIEREETEDYQALLQSEERLL